MSSEHGNLLKESVADFVARRMSVARARALRNTAAEYDRALWKEIAALGWLGVCIPEQYGGMSLGVTEAAAVAEGLARVLAPEPFTAAAVLAAGALVRCDNEGIKRELLPAFVSGERVLAMAWQESPGTPDSSDVATQAVPFEGGLRLSGRKRYVAGAAGADTYIVTARDGATLFVACVDADAAGVSVTLEPLADGRHFGSVQLDNVIVPRERVAAQGEAAASALSRAIDEAAVIASAELYGVMSRALEMAVDYMKTRVQFGRAIGS